MKLPDDYPNTSPAVHITTTGNGMVRFNPNLYANGKVCLSLLGTWHGEAWNKEVSNINQVLLSICFMIFVEEPYYNEPGYEANKPKASAVILPSTDTNNSVSSNLITQPISEQSLKYNSAIRIHTLRTAILEHLIRPDPDFGHIVTAFIRHNWPKSKLTYQKWAIEGDSHKILSLIADIESKLKTK